MLRLVVLMLAFLAGAKVWTQDTLFRSGAEEALVAAYRSHAVQACQRQQQPMAAGDKGGAAPVNWSRAVAIRMITGSHNVGVMPWQVDSPLWNARYRNPFLVLQADDRSPSLSCEFDILSGTAALIR